jgi:hypothetical protein
VKQSMDVEVVGSAVPACLRQTAQSSSPLLGPS